MRTTEHYIATEWIDILIGRAKDLRAAGITRVQAGGLSADLAPLAGEAPARPAAAAVVELDQPTPAAPAEEEPSDDPWTDPATYGGVVPGLRPVPPEEPAT